VLRGMQFVARFNLRAAPETIDLCRNMNLAGLSAERLFGEWSKLLLKGVSIARGLEFLRDTNQLTAYPELAALIDCPQDPQWHPEGDVWVHTGHCLDFFAAHRTGSRYEDLVVGLAVLCHDLGKPATTRLEDGRWRAKRHASAGLEPTTTFVQRLTAQKNLLEDVLPLVKDHLVPRELFDIQAGDAALRRLARRVGRIDRLARVSAADAMGRPPLSDWNVERLMFDWLVQRATALEVLDAAPKPILLGRHLLELGMTPGPGIGALLAACYEAQLDGKVTSLDEATRFAGVWLAQSKRQA
jgi:tRNA nucleotidyltransferase (CCA-adding enzyme)